MTLYPQTLRKQYDGTPLSWADQDEVVLVGFSEWVKLGYTYHAVVVGERTQAGKSVSTITELYIFDPAGNDVTEQFDITLKMGRVHVYYEKLTFASEGCEMVYNGMAPELIVRYDPSIDDILTVVLTSTVGADVGTRTHTFNVRLLDRNDQDVSDEYWIVRTYGKVEITHREITLKAGDATKAYDGTALTCKEYSIESGELAPGDYIDSCLIVGQQTEIGRSDNIISKVVIRDAQGKVVTSNYIIKPLPGKLRVVYNTGT